MKNKNKISKTLAGIVISLVAVPSSAQVSSKGLVPAANALGSFTNASIVRDSGLNQPLDLLNDFYPAIEVSVVKHDNVRRRSDLEEPDTSVVARPSLAYRTNFGRHQFYAAYSGVFTFHEELDQEDAQSNTLAAQLGLDLSRRWGLNLLGGVGRSFEERGISGSRPFNRFLQGIDSGPDEIEYAHYGADLIYGRNVSRLNGVIGFEKHAANFENNFQGNENRTGGRDRDTDSVHLDISYQIGDRTSVFGRVHYTEVDYKRNLNSLDSEQTDYLFGLRWKPSNALSGVVGIGASDKDFDDPQRTDYDDSTYYANLTYTLSPFSYLELSASRTVEEPGDDLSDFYQSDLIGIGWDHSISPQLVFNAYAKWVDDEYNTGRNDDFFDFGLGLDYIWRPWLKAGVFYGQIEQNSTLAAAEYEDTYYGLRLQSDLRPLLRGRSSRVEPDSFDYPKPVE